MGLVFTEPGGVGSGTLQIDFSNGPAFGLYFFVVTFNQGSFSAGWLYGVDIPLNELQTLMSVGPPFLGFLDACGAFKLGPFGGVGFLTGHSDLCRRARGSSARPADALDALGSGHLHGHLL